MPLSPELLESLRELTRGELQQPIPDDHAAALIDDGYAAREGRTLMVTMLGRALLATEAQRLSR